VLEGCSDDARRVVSVAIDEARRLGNARVGTEHLLLGLLADDGEAATALHAAGATLTAARHTVAEIVTETGSSTGGELPFTPRAQRALERAGRFSRRDRATEVTPVHVLLGLLDVEGLACQVLRGLGVDLARLRDSVVEQPRETPPPVVEPSPMLPNCPHCRATLADNLAQTTVAARSDDGSLTRLYVVYCAACGATLGFRDQ
jgi:ATP-dependent Clp protease ATP-binding subunit ClpA